MRTIFNWRLRQCIAQCCFTLFTCLIIFSANGQSTALPLGQALETEEIWSTSSLFPWLGQPDITHDGVDAAMTTVSGYYYSSSLSANIQGPVRVGFWWRFDALTNNSGRYALLMDGSTVVLHTNVGLWVSNYFDVPFGSHNLSWTTYHYADQFQVRGELDQVSINPLAGDAPQVTLEPSEVTAEPGQRITLHASVLGTPPYTITWKKRGDYYALPPKIADLTIASLSHADAGTYDVIVTNMFGQATASSVVAVDYSSLNASLDAPTLKWTCDGFGDWYAQAVTMHDGISAAHSPSGFSYNASFSQTTLKTKVTGPALVKYWVKFAPLPRFDWEEQQLRASVEGGRTIAYSSNDGQFDWKQDSIVVPHGERELAFTLDLNFYGQGTAWIDQVDVEPLVGDPPVITSQINDKTVTEGDNMILSVGLTGSAPMSYQWYYDDYPIENATNRTFELAVTSGDAGYYYVAIENPFGEVVSDPIVVTVNPSTITLPTALDNSDLAWKTFAGGWFGERGTTHDHVSAAQSAADQTPLQTTVIGPGTLSFWWKSSGVLYFQIDPPNSSLITNYNAGGNWQQVSIGIPDGPHIVTWNPEGGVTRSFVDQVRFVSGKVAPPKIVTQPQSQWVNPDDMATLSVVVSGVGPFQYQWTFNGADIPEATDSSIHIDDVTGDNLGSYAVRVFTPFGVAQSQIAVLGFKTDLGTAAGNPGLAWTVGTDYDWTTQTRIKHGRSPAFQSLPLGDGQQDILNNTVIGPGTLTFWWKTSSETNFDVLQFWINDLFVTNISGETGWRQQSIQIPAGAQTVSWVYQKDYSWSSGQDCGWVSDIVFTPAPPPSVQLQPHEQTVFDGSAAQMHAVNQGPTSSYLWIDNFGNQYDGGPDFKFVPARSQVDDGTYTVIVTAPTGTSFDSAILHVKPAVRGVRAMPGSNIRLKFNITNDVPDGFAWSHNDNPLSDDAHIKGAVTSTLKIYSATPDDSGTYGGTAVNSRTGYMWQTQASVHIINPAPIIGWGMDDYYGGMEINTPAWVRDAVEICAGTYNSVALLSDGTIAQWDNYSGSAGYIPDGLTNVVSVGIGNDYTLALQKNGDVVGWNDSWETSTVMSDVRSIAAGPTHFLMLTRGGTVFAQGSNDSGESDVPNDLRRVMAVSAGSQFSLALTRSGQIVGWGNNDFGQLSHPHLAGVIAIAAGGRHALALLQNHTVVAWGDNRNGQTKVPAGLKNVVAIAAGDNHSVALTADGEW